MHHVIRLSALAVACGEYFYELKRSFCSIPHNASKYGSQRSCEGLRHRKPHPPSTDSFYNLASLYRLPNLPTDHREDCYTTCPSLVSQVSPFFFVSMTRKSTTSGATPNTTPGASEIPKRHRYSPLRLLG